MYSRFRDSLLYPRLILEYRNDKIIVVFLYIILFAILLSTRMVIDVIKFDGLTVSDQEIMAQEFQDVNPDCGIVDAVYSCTVEESTLFYQDLVVGYYFESNSELQLDTYESQYNIVIYQDSLYFIFNGTVIYEQLLSQLPTSIHNLDFNLQTTDPDAFNEQIFSALEDYLMSYKSIWAPMMIIIDFFTGLFLFFLFIVISAWMLRVRFKEVPFRQLFTMTAYSSTGLYLILIFNTLYNLNFIVVILLIFFAFRQNNQLSLEIVERLKKKP